MNYFILFCFLTVILAYESQTQTKNATKEEVKAMKFSDLVEQAKNAVQSNETIEAAIKNLQDKLKSESDNPFNSSKTASEAVKIVEQLCNLTSNQTQMNELLKEVQSKIETSLSSDKSGEYCKIAQEYLNVSEILSTTNEQHQNPTLKENMQKATNLFLSCANFQDGSLNLTLANSNVSMKSVNPHSDTEVNITSGKNRVKINQQMMNKLKELANIGNDEQVIISITSQKKNFSGLNSNKTQKIPVSEIITAEFKKKTSKGIEDFTVGQLNDGVTIEVEFQDAVNKSTNMCARYENSTWVQSGKFQESDSETSNICLMSHASDYSIVAQITDDEASLSVNAARFGICILTIISLLLLL